MMKTYKFKTHVARKYYRHVRFYFPLHNKQEKRFLQFFKKKLLTYEKNNPQAEEQNYINDFGSPETIAASFYEHIDDQFMLSRMKSRKIIHYSCMILVFSIVISLIYVTYTTYELYHTFEESYPYYYETTIYEYSDTGD